MRNTARNFLFSASVAGALLFGATTVLADAPSTAECSEPFAQGSCGSQIRCQTWCVNNGYPPGHAICTSTGCCFCDAI
jgi:hypothetical protein